MENPVCALVEKQFVTTFPGALEFQLTVGGGGGGYLPGTGRADRAVQGWGDGTLGLILSLGPTASKAAPLCPGLCDRGNTSFQAWVSGGGGEVLPVILPSQYSPHGAAERTRAQKEMTCLGPQSWEEHS